MMRSILFLSALLLSSVVAFAPPSTTLHSKTTALYANEDDLLRWAKSSRSADVNDRVVELKRPLGLVLQEDDDGNVFVETVAPRGNAGRSGQVIRVALYYTKKNESLHCIVTLTLYYTIIQLSLLSYYYHYRSRRAIS
jgi:hypothetical protein